MPSSARLAYACIDIGSNTTRLLVAQPEDTGLRELATRRAFTRIGADLQGAGAISQAKIAETAQVVADHVAVARSLGAGSVAIVATAAIRDATNATELANAVRARSGLRIRVLSGEEEARLAFAGATAGIAAPPDSPVAVLDVGGGSTEIAVGTRRGGVSWSRSYRVGSGSLAARHLASDPPTRAELDAASADLARVFDGLDPPEADTAVAVGGSATSLRRLVGGELTREALQRSLAILSGSPVADIAERFELHPERVRLLPAGLLILDALSERVRRPLSLGTGGVREGVILELAASR